MSEVAKPKPTGDQPNNKEKDNKKNKEEKEEVLTEEDQRKKEELELLVTRTQDPEEGIVKMALEALRKEIRTSTSSMTAIPKPLKFLHPHYDTMKAVHEKTKAGPNKNALADILSVLAMTHENKDRECLKYRLQGTTEDTSAWGHEYLRHLASEIAEEYEIRADNKQPVEDLLKLVDEIIPYNVTHNAEPEACDLLLEVDQLPRLLKHVDVHNFQRIASYLVSNAFFDDDAGQTLKVVLEIYKKMNQLPRALQVAIRINDRDLISEVFKAATEQTVRRQLAAILGRQHLFDIVDIESEEDRSVVELSTNANLPKYFAALAKDLEITEAKHPEDIYKSHLTEGKQQAQAKMDSARANLASTIVNAFVNAGSGIDKLMTVPQDAGSVSWVHKNKEHAMLTAAASLGMIYQWDVSSERLSELDKYLYSNDENIKAGALLGIGLLATGVRSEFDPALGLLGEYLETKNSATLRQSAALGMGLAYAGTNRPEVKEMLLAALDDPNATMEVIGTHALALGLLCVGTGDFELTEKLCGVFEGKNETQLKNTYTRFISVGLGLLFLGKKDASEVCVELLKAVAGPVGKYAALTVETMAYAFSGSMVKVQDFLHACNEHLEKDNEFQSVAVLGIALIAMTEEIGTEMALRTYDHLLQYGEVNVRRTVPLALALLCVGNPAINVMDNLSKLTHDHDAEVAMAAIFALGMIGCGTNNSRIAQMLRQLAAYYYKEPNNLFMVRVAQGLLHMGKGTISVKPSHSQGLCINWAGLGSLIALIHACLDLKGLILGKAHYLLYLVAPAMHPRWLMTLDAQLEPKPILVRVGQAIDIVGQPGKPKTITGFQTHNTPVLISHGERAELATDEYLTASDVLEGLVLVTPNPDSKKNKMEVD